MDDGDRNEENDSSSECSSYDGIPVASTGIIMLSLPDTSEEEEGDNNDDGDNNNNNNNSAPDVFQTPPEYSHPGTSDEDRTYEDVGDGRGIIVAVGGGGGTDAVDLGRDAELGFSEVELMEFKVLKRELSPGGGSAVSPLKKLRICPRDSESEGESPCNLSSGSRQSLEIDGCGDAKLGEEQGSAKRKLEFLDNESDDATTEEDGSVLGVEDSDEEGFGSGANDDTSYSCGWQPRALPRSIGGQAELNVKCGEGHKKFSHLLNNVVKLLKERSGDGDDGVENCSFLEIYRRRGMT